MNTERLAILLQDRVNEIVNRLEDKVNGPSSDLVRLIESTRARTLMDILECIKASK